MLNRLRARERSIVSDMPGTTRDAVDTIVNHGERTYRFVDTAGIRRKGQDETRRREIERGDGAAAPRTS